MSLDRIDQEALFRVAPAQFFFGLGRFDLLLHAALGVGVFAHEIGHQRSPWPHGPSRRSAPAGG